MPGKVIDPNQNQKERNYGVVYVYDEATSQNIPNGIYIYSKARRDGTRGLLAGDIIGILGQVIPLTPLQEANVIPYQCKGRVRFNGILTTQQNAPVIRRLRNFIGDVDEVEDMIEELIQTGDLKSEIT